MATASPQLLLVLLCGVLLCATALARRRSQRESNALAKSLTCTATRHERSLKVELTWTPPATAPRTLAKLWVVLGPRREVMAQNWQKYAPMLASGGAFKSRAKETTCSVPLSAGSCSFTVADTTGETAVYVELADPRDGNWFDHFKHCQISTPALIEEEEEVVTLPYPKKEKELDDTEVQVDESDSSISHTVLDEDLLKKKSGARDEENQSSSVLKNLEEVNLTLPPLKISDVDEVVVSSTDIEKEPPAVPKTPLSELLPSPADRERLSCVAKTQHLPEDASTCRCEFSFLCNTPVDGWLLPPASEDEPEIDCAATPSHEDCFCLRAPRVIVDPNLADPWDSIPLLECPFDDILGIPPTMQERAARMVSLLEGDSKNRAAVTVFRECFLCDEDHIGFMKVHLHDRKRNFKDSTVCRRHVRFARLFDEAVSAFKAAAKKAELDTPLLRTVVVRDDESAVTVKVATAEGVAVVRSVLSRTFPRQSGGGSGGGESGIGAIKETLCSSVE